MHRKVIQEQEQVVIIQNNVTEEKNSIERLGDTVEKIL
jgi:hypothetical protein